MYVLIFYELIYYATPIARSCEAGRGRLGIGLCLGMCGKGPMSQDQSYITYQRILEHQSQISVD